MEVIVIAGKRENSKHFFISDLDEIYSNHSKANDVKFVCCYHDNCRARGKIGADGLFYASEGQHGQHSNHNFTTASVLNFLKCFNEMKEEARSSGKLPNVVYDEVMAKYHGSFEQSLTFPSVQQTLLKCRRQYFPRFPQTADEFFKVFENQLILRRYGHCFDDLFFHGVATAGVANDGNLTFLQDSPADDSAMSYDRNYFANLDYETKIEMENDFVQDTIYNSERNSQVEDFDLTEVAELTQVSEFGFDVSASEVGY
ncbi:hypothetical protein Bhyg_03318 [Pseudolycoriella hygida]|uniref:Uncharacterized protein n=1 Tax=Pseudolycoriella hygida TaxID=35572 RepID=A0A9Q0ND49_9DIPT|nr:hypothetical protein Bhyg_03318 [Pseudolycoriella hygida]